MARINWKKEFEEADDKRAEYHYQLRILKFQELICEAAKNCDDIWVLKNMARFCANIMDMRFVDNGIEDMRIVKEGAAV